MKNNNALRCRRSSSSPLFTLLQKGVKSSISAWCCCGLLLYHRPYPARHNELHLIPDAHDDRRVTRLTHECINVRNYRESGALCEYGLVVAHAKEMRVDNGCQKGVLEEKCTKCDAEKYRELSKGDEFHCTIIVC